MLISILQYPCSIVHTPQRVYKDYKKIITNFIWGGRKPKISYSSLIKPVPLGGLNLIDLGTRVRANLIQWARRLVSKQQMSTRISMAIILQVEDVESLFYAKDATFLKSLPFSRFYGDLLSVWSSIRCFEPVGEESIRREPLWFNRRINWDCSTMKRYRWQEAGINTVNDICHDTEGRLLSYEELQNKFQVPCSFLDALRLRMSVPLHWQTSLTRDWSPQNTLPHGPEIQIEGREPVDISNYSSKRAYSELLQANPTTNAAYHK